MWASPLGPRATFVSFGPMQVLCRQPCNATRRIQTTLTGHSLATQLNWNGSNQKRPFQNLLFHIGQGSSNLAHEIHFHAEFSSNLNQTHLSMSSGSLENHRWVSLIKVGAKLCRKVDLTRHIWGVTDMSLLIRILWVVFFLTTRGAGVF